MKDAKGHGSDSRGTTKLGAAGSHQTDVMRVGRPNFTVNAEGKKVSVWNVSTRQGQGYQTQANYKNPTTAERQAQLARVDQRKYGAGNVKLTGDMKEAFRRQRFSQFYLEPKPRNRPKWSSFPARKRGVIPEFALRRSGVICASRNALVLA
jgi:hypothetical protein